MDRKVFICFFLSLIQLFFLQANENSLEIRSAAFFHSSERFRHIYGNVGGDYQLEGSNKLYNDVDGWANIGWFSKYGHSEGLSDPTRVNIVNISCGVKFPYRFSDKFTGYVGIGPSLARIWLKNKSHCGHGNASKWAIGAVLKTGVNFLITERVFIDVFIDYLYQPVHFKTDVDIGGIKTGLGLGVKF